VVVASDTESGADPAVAVETVNAPGLPLTESSLIALTEKVTVWEAVFVANNGELPRIIPRAVTPMNNSLLVNRIFPEYLDEKLLDLVLITINILFFLDFIIGSFLAAGCRLSKESTALLKHSCLNDLKVAHEDTFFNARASFFFTFFQLARRVMEMETSSVISGAVSARRGYQRLTQN